MPRGLRIARALALGLRDATAATTLVSVVGCVVLLVLGRIGGGPSDWVEAIAWAAGAGALAGIGLGPVMAAWRWVAPSFGRASASAWAIGWGLALPVLEVGVAVAAADWARRHVHARAGFVVGAAIVAAALTLVVGSRRAARSTLARWVATLAPALTPLGVWLALPEHVRAHSGVDWVCALAAVLPYASAPARPRRTWGTVAVAVVTIVWLALRFGARPGLRAEVEREHGLVQRVVAAATRTVDLDGDGTSGWFGGGDCAPWDRAAGPGRAEIAGNGVDDNCVGGDLPDDAPATVHIGDAPSLPAPIRNVLVVCVDALRPDRMSLYGYDLHTTPAMEARLADAFVFERAYAEAASTRDTLPSLLSGRSRFELWWYRHANVTLDPRERLLPHHLQDRGFATVGVLPLVAINMMGTSRVGLSRLSIYDDKVRRSAPLVTSSLLAALDETNGPFFAYVHYYEPHEPYIRHARARKVSDDPYDHEVVAIDRAIDVLWRQLERRGLLDDTLVIITADHGEAFGEHGHRFHNVAAYEEDLRVPLIIRVPGQPGRRIATPVSNTAVAATILQLVGVPAPAAGPTVPSLWPLMAGTTDAAPPVFAVARPQLDRERFAYIEGDHKVIFDRTLSSLEIYDLAADPSERRNLLGLDPALTEPLVARAAATFDRTVGGAQSRRRRAMVAQAAAPGATAVDVEAAPGVQAEAVAAWTIDDPAEFETMAARVLVRAYLRRTATTPEPLDYDVTIERDGSVVLQAGGPAWYGQYDPSAWSSGELVEDSRVFKVYPRDLDAHVVVRIGATRVDLGPVRDLPVAP